MNLFKVSNKTRKKKTGEKKEPGIRIKQPVQKKKNETLKKKSILKMIRQHQQERYSNLFDEKKSSKDTSKESVKSKESELEKFDGFNKEFEEAQKFMKQLTEKTESVSGPKNTTIKQYPTTTTSLLFDKSIDPFSSKNALGQHVDQGIEPLKDMSHTIVNHNNHIPSSNMTLKPTYHNPANTPPNYGCLKHGQLPTYRNYMNKTHKAYHPSSANTTIINNQPMQVPSANAYAKTFMETRNEHIENKLRESMNRVNEMKQIEQKLQQLKPSNKAKKMKRKKTIRRTFKLGKSKMQPKVSVLVSNKTIRNNITTKAQLLKQTPIEEVKKHLIKCGLIKVGTIAPNDVLRKMYESSVMMCGDLTNHNPDYLLYNFLHSK